MPEGSDDPAGGLGDLAPCGYLTTTPDGVLTAVNDMFLALTGYQRHELVGVRRFVDLLTVGGRIYHETHFAPMLQMQGTVREIAFELRCADGRPLPVLVNSIVERGPSGEPVAVRTVVLDATERRAYEQELLRAKQRAEKSERRATALAQTLQRSFLPPSDPQIPGLEIAGRYVAADDGGEVGGDFYDVFEVNENDWCVALGDVEGKGVDAAVVTSLARHTLRAVAVRQASPAIALGSLNAVLRSHETDRHCTALVMRLRQRAAGSWEAVLGCAGHSPPLLLRHGGGPEPVAVEGPLLGFFDGPAFSDTLVQLGVGDALVLFTDGTTEARSSNGDFYGTDRLAATLASLPSSAAELTDGLLRAVMQFQAGRARDDIAIVTVRVPQG